MLARIRPLVETLRTAPAPVRAGAVVAVALAWVFWPTFTELAGRWGAESQYSHGYLVPAFAAYLLWARRDLLARGSGRPSVWGLALLAAGLGLRFAGTYVFFDWLAAAAVVPCLAGLALLVGGGRALRWSWPALAFLLFMVPLPHQVQIALAHPLQRVATRASTYALQTFGFVAYAEGTVIHMGEVRIGVVEACSGLSMLLIFFALSTAVVLLIQRPWYERLLLFFSAIPIALLSNFTRITVTGVLHKTVGRELADHVFHDLAGWLMMVLALVLLWVELRLLAWVLVPRETAETPGLALGLARGNRGTAAAPAAAAKPELPAAAKGGRRVVLAGLGLVVPPNGKAKASTRKGGK